MASSASCPALLIAAPASGQGKTTVTAALARLHEIIAADLVQQAEDERIQHVPGADLLFDHVEAGVFDLGRGG